jgi:hypothetical protein
MYPAVLLNKEKKINYKNKITLNQSNVYYMYLVMLLNEGRKFNSIQFNLFMCKT